MMKYRLLLIYIIFQINVTSSKGQYYNTGQDPASLKWMQINTDHFKIIYPESYGQNGPDFARTLESSYKKLTSLFPEKKFKIPVVIHNNTIQSNGYVAWAPRRMEIHPTPEQSTIPLDPAEQLAIHELTHVMQMESLNTGFSRAASFLLGEQATGAVSSLIPLWYFEGDAVFSESVLTRSGRGRSPSFQKQIKAMILEKGQIYKYDKMLNGSFRNYVPDHYQSGFQMIAWSRSKYDHTIWDKALKFTGQQPFTLNPVNISLRNNYSLTKKKLFSQTFDTLKVLWKSEDAKSSKETYEILNPPKNDKYISYFSPVRAGSDSIIAVRTSLSQPPCFVLINQKEKTEKRIFTPGHFYPYFISFGDGKIVWVELNPDPRWENRNYSVIKILDTKRNLVRRISRRSRYMSASVSPDGNTIAAVENTTDNRNNLLLIDALNFKIIQTVPVPGNASLQRPEWSENGKVITVINLTKEGEGIIKYDPGNQTWETLIEPGRIDIQSSSFRNDSLFFVSSRSGTENISLLKPDKSETIITNSRFGATDLSICGRNVMFSDYSSSGNNICSTKLYSDANGSGVRTTAPVFLIDRFDDPGNNEPVAFRNAEEQYTPEPYSKMQHLFRFHSWMPFYTDIDELTSDPQTFKPGLTVMTQNSLSTLISTTGYKYSDNRHQVHSKISWQGWYPVFNFDVNYGGEPLISKQAASIADPSEIRQGLDFTGSITLPLVFSSGNFSQFIRPSFSVSYENNYIYIREEGIYDYGQPQLNGRFYFSNYSRSAARDIYPRWAQVIDLNYGFYPSDKDLFGDLANIRTAFYFPGIFNNQGIRFRYEADRQKFRRFYQSNRAAFPRGYLNLLYPHGNINIYSEKLDFLSVDYAIPLVYPDFNLVSLLYIKRIRSGLFYDFARGTNNFYDKPSPLYNRFTEDFNSFGFEMLADFYLLRIPFMISAGVQTAWKSIGTTPSFELLFNFDIYGMSIGKRPGY
jgi:hypothetical protein